MSNENNNTWLCRNCNSLISNDIDKCPRCDAERPETLSAAEQMEQNELSETTIVEENYTNAVQPAKSKYNFRESVLTFAADTTLVLGLFCTFGALISPMFIADVENIKLMSICAAVLLFAFSMVQWALLRSVADISRRLRERDEESNE